MADLLGRFAQIDAAKHFQGEVARDRTAAMPYLAAVHEEMAGKAARQQRL